MTDQGQLVVDPRRLAEVSDRIQGAITALNSQLDQLETAAGPLVATWSGEAQQAYQQRQQTWRQTSAELATMLQAIRRGLNESIVDYQGTEKTIIGMFTR